MDEQFLLELKQILFSLNDRVEKLEHTLNDVIISSWKEAAEEEAAAEKARLEAEARKIAIEQFTAKYPAVAELSAPLKALYGDDYDVYGDLYDVMQSHINDEGFDEGAYVNGQIEDVKNRLAAVNAPIVEEKKTVEEKEQPVVIDEAQLAKELAEAE